MCGVGLHIMTTALQANLVDLSLSLLRSWLAWFITWVCSCMRTMPPVLDPQQSPLHAYFVSGSFDRAACCYCWSSVAPRRWWLWRIFCCWNQPWNVKHALARAMNQCSIYTVSVSLFSVKYERIVAMTQTNKQTKHPVDFDRVADTNCRCH